MKTRVINCFAFPLANFTGFGDLKLSNYEERVLNTKLADYIWQSGFSQSFLAWRRRLLYCASVFLAVSASMKVAHLVENGFFTTEQTTYYTKLGLTALVISRIIPFVACAVSIASAWFWTEYIKSRTILVSGWMFIFSLILVFSLIPLNYMFVVPDRLKNMFLSVIMAIAMLPAFLALIGGLSLGSRRVFYFAPSPLTGALVVLSHAFSVIIPFAALSVIVHLLGDALLLAGVYSLLVGPILVVMTSSRFTATNASSSSESLLVTQRILIVAGLFRLTGLIVILVWLILLMNRGVNWVENGQTENIPIEGLNSARDVAETVAEFLGSNMFQAVMWTDVVIHVSRNDDLKLQKLQSDLF